MKVLEVALISIGAQLLIILCALPLILDVKGRQAWTAPIFGFMQKG